MLVRRTLVEKIILTALRERLASPENVRHVLERVEEEVKKLYAHIPEAIRMKETELASEERRLANQRSLPTAWRLPQMPVYESSSRA
jgi:hypothetical protein